MNNENRVIKFRAWDTISNKMLYATNHAPSGIRSTDFSCVEFIHLQFTGLTDKHKKDIYEGDIILLNTSNDKSIVGMDFSPIIENYKVVYSNDLAGFTLDAIDTKIAYGLFDTPESMEVIGNIYENPNY